MKIDGHRFDHDEAEMVSVVREANPHAPYGVRYFEVIYRVPGTGAWFREQELRDHRDYANHPRRIEYLDAEVEPRHGCDGQVMRPTAPGMAWSRIWFDLEDST